MIHKSNAIQQAAEFSIHQLEQRTLLNAISFTSVGGTDAHGTGQYLSGWKNGVVIEDVNQDGKEDVVTTGGVALGDGTGIFTHRFTFSDGSEAPAVAVADFTGDAIPDVLLLGRFNRFLLRGLGDGTFVKQSTSAFTSIEYMKVADVNGDNLPDVLTSYSGASIGVELGNGNGTFHGVDSNLTAPSGTQLNDFNIHDVNKDGKLDILSYSSNFNQRQSVVHVWLGNGDGTFKAEQQFSCGVFPRGLSVGDLNGDGKVDLVTSNVDEATDSASLSILWGDGKGHFATSKSISVNYEFAQVAVTDIDGDGRMDIVALDNVISGNGTFAVWLGTAAGNFQTESDFSAGTFTTGIYVKDVNSDGKPDLVIGGHHDALLDIYSEFRVRLNTSTRSFGTLGSTGTFTANGTSGKDKVSIFINKKGKLEVDSNFGSQTFSKSQVKRISITLNGGADKLSVGPGIRAITVAGGNGNDTITGGDANDYILGGAGADRLNGGGGDDTLSGGGGNDRLTGDVGADQLFGGPGNDKFFVRDGFADTISGNAGIDTAQLDDVLDTAASISSLLA